MSYIPSPMGFPSDPTSSLARDGESSARNNNAYS